MSRSFLRPPQPPPRRPARLFLPLAACLACAIATHAAAAPAEPQADEPITPLPLRVEIDADRAALGSRLFRETLLSRHHSESCATCHPFEHGGVDGLPRAPSAGIAGLLRNTPTVFNAAFNPTLNWDGSARSLEEQADQVIRSPAQFDNDWPTLLATLQAAPAYVSAFNNAYPDGLTQHNVLDAIATYQRSLVTPNSRFDKYLRGQRDALTPVEQEGYRLFKGFGCVACHQGMNVGGNLYQKFGVFRDTKPGRRPDEAPDLGRYELTKLERDREVFRVPSLRNVALTAPYFHDGRAKTLDSAVRTMAKVQLDRELAAPETEAIVQFLRSLTGEWQGKPLTLPATEPAPR